MTATESATTRGEQPEPKLASRIAAAMTTDIVRSGWAPGKMIGSELELLERYDVSRAVFRESLRILEHLGVASTKRGPGGGVIITEPSSSAVIEALLVYLAYVDIPLADLMAARISLEGTVVRLAAERGDEAHIRQLRSRVDADQARTELDSDDHHVLHTLVAAAAANPAAELFVDILGRLTARWSYPEVDAASRREALHMSARAHAAIVEAIASGDGADAERRMRAHLTALSDWLMRKGDSRPRTLDKVLDATDDRKLGWKVAREIVVELDELGWPLGEVVGTEPGLIERFGVSRSAVREAVRLLEHLRVAVMKRGPGGGLISTAPDIEPIISAATVYLEYRGIKAADVVEVRRDLEFDGIDLVVANASDAEIGHLREVAEHNARAGFVVPGSEVLNVRIAELSGNRAIGLFVRILVELTTAHAAIPGLRSPRRAAINAEVERAYLGIVSALEDRDAAIAKRRLAKHLQALQPLLR